MAPGGTTHPQLRGPRSPRAIDGMRHGMRRAPVHASCRKCRCGPPTAARAPEGGEDLGDAVSGVKQAHQEEVAALALSILRAVRAIQHPSIDMPALGRVFSGAAQVRGGREPRARRRIRGRRGWPLATRAPTRGQARGRTAPCRALLLGLLRVSGKRSRRTASDNLPICDAVQRSIYRTARGSYVPTWSRRILCSVKCDMSSRGGATRLKEKRVRAKP